MQYKILQHKNGRCIVGFYSYYDYCYYVYENTTKEEKREIDLMGTTELYNHCPVCGKEVNQGN